jgi:1,4-dihydroxy-2-naphthoate octaprenyltransferase
LKHKKENGIIAKYETDLFPVERQAGNMAKKLQIRDAVNLAAPHTWAASVMPCVLASALSYRQQGFLRADLTVCLFLIAILMQSSVNALNDYADFVKGTDTAENSPDPTDAVIVYGMRPETARNLGIAYLTAAFVLGAYTVWRCGWVLLVIGLIGALVIAAYSGGKTPISYLPLGELVSGFVMGGLIPLAGVRMQTGVLRFSVLAEALPVIIGIGMIMFSNNGCDIERDLQAGRRTLPCLLGREKTDRLYRMMLAVWLLSPVLIFAVQRRWMSMLLYVLSSLVFLSHFQRQSRTPLGEEKRGMIMAGATNLVILTGFAYSFAILVG